jgi:DNA-binding response OmpR family regulator
MTASRRVVLLWEDDAATRKLYRRELGRTFRVLTCGGEQEAVALLGSEPVDALVLEPAALREGLQGESWWFMAWLHNEHPHLPVVVCSILDLRGRSTELGAAAYLIKPVTPAELVTTLSAVLAPALEPADAESSAQHPA